MKIWNRDILVTHFICCFSYEFLDYSCFCSSFVLLTQFLSLWMSFIFSPGSLFKNPTNMNFWGIHAPEFLTFLVRSITWLGLPSLVHERKAGCWNRWMKHLRFIIIVVFIYNPASASSVLFARISLMSPPVQRGDVTVGNAGADLCHFCFGNRGLPVNMFTFQVQDWRSAFVAFLPKEFLLTISSSLCHQPNETENGVFIDFCDQLSRVDEKGDFFLLLPEWLRGHRLDDTSSWERTGGKTASSRWGRREDSETQTVLS